MTVDKTESADRKMRAEDHRRVIVFLAPSPGLARTTGQYFVSTKPAPSAPITYDRDIAAGHWAICEVLTELREAHPVAAALVRSSSGKPPDR